jgi:hypothetical protein
MPMFDQKLLALLKQIKVPDSPILNAGKISKQFLGKKLEHFHGAINYVYQLKYVPPSEPFNFNLELEEEKGTCSTKHALLVALATELNLPIHLGLGICHLTPLKFPMIKDILKKFSIPYIPESHNFMICNNKFLDITFPGECIILSPTDIIQEEIILPEQITTYKAEMHKQYLNKWFKENDFSFTLEAFYEARKLCIDKFSEVFKYRG